MKRLWIGLGVAFALFPGACRLLPERYAVNVPAGNGLFGRSYGAPPESVFGSRIRVPEGLSIGVYAEGLPWARVLRFTPAGDLLVSLPRSGRVMLLSRDADGDGRADGARVLLEDLNRPHGLDLHEGWLYVGETDAIGRIRFDPDRGQTSGSFERLVTGLPAGGNHWTRTLRFGPDGWLYVSVGSSCNVCEEEDPRRAALLRFRPDGSGGEIYATGLRNAVGFDWRPETGELYATDNGRDLLGPDFPPCELDRIERGGFYGWPYANGNNVPDPDLGAGHEARIREAIPPAHGFAAHNAPLGISFVRGERAPASYRGAALVALHGSWNRRRKDGYKVVSLHFLPDGRIEERDFVTGFLLDDEVIGRPVDVAEGPDGALYVSDDYAGAVYRVAPGAGPAAGRPGAGPRAAGPAAPLAPAEQARLDRAGRELFERHACAGCHEAAAAAPGVVPVPLRGLASRYAEGDLASYLAAPAPPMPAFPLSDQERRALAVYLLAR
jgi:glucose/arabinose dehydrogenase